ncbi:YopX family protein [Lysinibacillus capsici]|uniref:YopX family protein n=1 Tax=Lysinibacillus capsici TaxID=2115968 RepID=UPI0028989C93|nr:YopX family protein [Lysinibacillus capsici]
MREVKFRAWMENKMLSHEDLVDMDQEFYAMYTILTEPQEDITFMQYTGLKVNGMEIYEGDILELYIPNWAGYDDVQRFILNEFCSDVTYLQAVVKHCEECSLEGESDYIEVIGNIYENPELLEESQNGTK